MSDPNRGLQEAELTFEEVERIFKVCGPHALLVGGQALDFLGSNETAQKLQRSLGQPWKLRKAALGDFGPQVAKVYATLPEQGVKQVDFLSGIVGLNNFTRHDGYKNELHKVDKNLDRTICLDLRLVRGGEFGGKSC